MESQEKLLVNSGGTDQWPNMLDCASGSYIGLDTKGLGFDSHLQRILIETLGEGMLIHREDLAWWRVNSMGL